MKSQEEQIQRSDQPLTYARFLECLDAAKYKFGRVQCASANGKTLALLLNEIVPSGMSFEATAVQIYGIPMEVDRDLPDNAIKIDGRMYNTADCLS